MTNLFLFGAIVLLLIQAHAILLKSDNGNLYYLETENNESWYNAVKTCQSKNMSLLAIETRDKHYEIYNMLKQYSDNLLKPTPFFWTSGKKFEKVFKWSANNSEMVFTNWGSNPITDRERTFNNCDVCMTIKGSYLDWYPDCCEYWGPFICEGKILNPNPTWVIDELKQSLNQALKVTVSKKQLEVDDLKKPLEKQLADKGEEVDILMKLHAEELTTQRKACENKVFAYIDKTLKESRTQWHKDFEELKKFNEAPKLSPLENISKSSEDEGYIFLQDKKNELQIHQKMWFIIKKSHEHQINLFTQDKKLEGV